MPEGISFANKKVLVTGCGKGSIGIEIVKALISGGAYVIVTTSRFTHETTEMYKNIYEEFGGKDSQLVVLPFNQASQSDVNNLIQFIYSDQGLNIDLDVVIPFAGN